MIDREKVIKGLAVHLSNKVPPCDECPYANFEDTRRYNDPSSCSLSMMADALALLKEQEHSETFIVIDNKTGKEADTYNIALHEGWAKHLCYCDMEGWAIEEDGTLLLVDECGRCAYADRERFKVKWE